MSDFKFIGDWEFILYLEEFAKIYSTTDKSKNWNNHRLELMKGNTPIKIADYKSYEPDPLPEQIKTVELLITNQSKLLTGLLNAIEIINQDYVERCGVDSWIPNPLNILSIGELLCVEEIVILAEHKNELAYTQFDCSYKGDVEHGLSIVMYDQILIEYGGMFDLNYGKLYQDLGSAAEVFRSANIKNQEFGINMIHQKLPKYDKFKPWQKEASAEHLELLLRTKQNERLKEIIINKEWDYNYRFDYQDRNLVDLAAHYKNTEILNLLLEMGGDASRTKL